VSVRTFVPGKAGTTWRRRSVPGVSTKEAAQVRQLRRKVAELKRTIEILTAALGFFARAHDPRQG